jgi:hypothetical protein
VDLSGDVGAVAERLGEELVRRQVVPANAVVVLASVTPDLAPGPSNFLKVHRIGH